MNRIVEFGAQWDDVAERWVAFVRKEFAPEHGGGEQIFREPCANGCGGAHHALDVLRGMVTCSPGARTDLEAGK